MSRIKHSRNTFVRICCLIALNCWIKKNLCLFLWCVSCQDLSETRYTIQYTCTCIVEIKYTKGGTGSRRDIPNRGSPIFYNYKHRNLMVNTLGWTYILYTNIHKYYTLYYFILQGRHCNIKNLFFYKFIVVIYSIISC